MPKTDRPVNWTQDHNNVIDHEARVYLAINK